MKKFLYLLVILAVLASAVLPTWQFGAEVAYAVTDTYTTSGSWTCPAGVSSVQVEAWGGGGGGGASGSTSWAGGGGGGGAYSKKNSISVTPGSSYAYTVGTAGIRGVHNGGTTAGGLGGDSYWVDGSVLLAKGGGGGGAAISAAGTAGVGGASTSGQGDTKYSGGNGLAGTSTYGGGGGGSGGTASDGTTATGQAGAAAVTGGGNGGNGGAVHADGVAPTTPPGGGGGGEGHHYTTNFYGGVGSVGKITITYIYQLEITTIAAASVTTTTATLNGNVSLVLSGGNVTNYGFGWDTSSKSPVSVAPSASGYSGNYASGTVDYGNGTLFDSGSQVTGLSKGTLYYFRAAGNNTLGWIWGSELKYLTIPDPPSGCTVTSYGEVPVTWSWTKSTGTSITTTWRYKTGSYPSNSSDGSSAYLGSGNSSTIDGLAGNTTYYFAGWSIASGSGVSDKESTTSCQFSVLTLTPTVVSYTTSGNFTAPADVYFVEVEVWGSGGGGGGSGTDQNASGGGGGGAYSKKYTIPVVPGGNYTYVIGTAGAGGYNSAGIAGGDSYFGNSTTVMAKGGGAGQNNGGVGGSGGDSASGYGDVKYSGGSGGYSFLDGNGGGGGGGSAGNTSIGNNGQNSLDGGAGGVAVTGGGAGGAGGAFPWDGSNAPSLGGGGGGSSYGYLGIHTGGNGYAGKVTVTYATFTSISAPTVTTSAATSVAETTATINGSVTGTGGENPTVTQYWGDNDGGQTPGDWDNSSAPTSPSQPQGVASFYKNITGLTELTLYYYIAKATNSGGTGWGTTGNFTTLEQAVGVSIGSATSIACTTATLKGNITSVGSNNATYYKFEWDDVNSGSPYTYSYTSNVGSYGVAEYSRNITSLPVNTIVYFRFGAYNSAGWYYSSEGNFTTLNEGLPQIASITASSVLGTSATLNGNVTDVNSQCNNVTYVGFGWDTSSKSPGNVAPSASGYAGNLTSGIVNYGNGTLFDSGGNVTGLSKGTLYYFRSAGKNDVGWGWGSELKFLTIPDPPSDCDVTVQSGYSLAIGWTKGTGAGNTTWRYQTGSYPGNSSAGSSAYLGSGTSTTVVGLVGNTTYYFSGWSIAYGSGVSNQESTSSCQFSYTVRVPTIVTETSAGTFYFIAPAFVYAVEVEVWGGGGGATGTQFGGPSGGGGGGAYSKKYYIPVVPGGNYTYVVGAGGAMGLSWIDAGDGEDSYFGNSTTVMAKGGTKGDHNKVAGSGGYSASGYGDVKYSGGDGGTGTTDVCGGGGGGSGGTGSVGNPGENPDGAGNVTGGGEGGDGGVGYGGAGSSPSFGPGGGGGGGSYSGMDITYGSAGWQGKVVIYYVLTEGLPTVTTSSATNIGNTTVTLNGNITNLNGGTILYYAWVYDWESNFAPASLPPGDYLGNITFVCGSCPVGSYSGNTTGLLANTRYYVRFGATNEVGWSWGDEVVFDTTYPWYENWNYSSRVVIEGVGNGTTDLQVPIYADTYGVSNWAYYPDYTIPGGSDYWNGKLMVISYTPQIYRKGDGSYIGWWTANDGGDNIFIGGGTSTDGLTDWNWDFGARLEKGTPSAYFDSGDFAVGSVVQIEDNSYIGFYSACRVSGTFDSNTGVGRFTFTNPAGTYDKPSPYPNAVIAGGYNDDEWSLGAYCQAIYNGNGSMDIWYMATHADYSVSGIARASSTDYGVTWTRHGIVIDSPATAWMQVAKLPDGKYIMSTVGGQTYQALWISSNGDDWVPIDYMSSIEVGEGGFLRDLWGNLTTDADGHYRAYNDNGLLSISNAIVVGNNNVNHDFSDFRITSLDGTNTLLPFTRMSNYDSDGYKAAKFYVKVPTIPAAGNITGVQCYWGRPSASYIGNGTNTFIFYDDFSNGNLATNWTTGGTPTIESGKANLDVGDSLLSKVSYDGLFSLIAYSIPVSVPTTTASHTIGDMYTAPYIDASNGIRFFASADCFIWWAGKGLCDLMEASYIREVYGGATSDINRGYLNTVGVNEIPGNWQLVEVWTSGTKAYYTFDNNNYVTDGYTLSHQFNTSGYVKLEVSQEGEYNYSYVAIAKKIATMPVVTFDTEIDAYGTSISNTPSGHYFGVVQPSSVYWASGSEPSSFTGNTTTKSPSSNTGSGWTDPTEAYANDDVLATITSGTPSDNNIWGNYSFTENSTVKTVEVGCEVQTDGIFPSYQYGIPVSDGNTTGTITLGQYRMPTGDGDQSAAWTNTYTDVDDYTDGSTAGDGDYMTSPADAGGGYGYFTFGNFTVPAGATINSVAVLIRARDDTLSTNNIACSLKVNGSQYVGDSNYPGTTFTRYRWEWTTNPDTSSAWTVDDVNGNGSNPLQQFGVKGTDFSPAFRLGICYATVDYTYAGYLYQNIDETSPDDTDYIFFQQDTDGRVGFIGNPVMPPPIFAVTLDVYFRIADADNTSIGTNSIKGYIKVGGTLYDTCSNQAPGDTFSTVYCTWDDNPKTGVDWTEDDLMGNGTNPLQEYGVVVSDGDPDIYVSMVYAQVTYMEENDQIRTYVSWDGGSNWSSSSSQTITSIMDLYWFDVTSATAWTPTKLNNDNFKVKVDAYTVASYAEPISLDWLPVRVTYSNPLSDENCTGNVTNDSSFPINVLFSMGNLTGGTQWTIGANPGSNIFRMRLYISGAGNLTDYTALSATPTDLIHELAAAAHQYYEFALDTPTNNPFSDGVLKSGEMLLAAEAH